MSSLLSLISTKSPLLFSYCAITHGPEKRKKKKTSLNIDFSLDDGHLDKGEVTLCSAFVSKEVQG